MPVPGVSVTLPTEKTVIGSFKNNDLSDIFQILDLHGSVQCYMNYLGVIQPVIVPVLQGEQTDVNIDTEQTLSFPLPVVPGLPVVNLYQVTLYYESTGGDGNNTESLSPTLAWTNAQGNVQSLAYPYLGAIVGGPWAQVGNDSNLQNYSIPVLAKSGTSVVLTSVFGGAYSFHYNMALRIVLMPINP